MLPGKLRVDFHFKDKAGTDVFVEMVNAQNRPKCLSKILNLFSSLSNLEPPLEKFELIVVGPEFEGSAKKALNGLPVHLVTFEELGNNPTELEALREEQKQFQERRLSPVEAKLVAMWEVEKKTVIRAKDVQDTLRCSANYAYVLLHNLERKHWLERINTGLYQFVPAVYGYPEKFPPANSFAIGATLVEPYYFSYYTANSHYGFTTQMPFTLFIATSKKKPEVEWQGVDFKFVTLSKRKFFGFRFERVFDAEV